MITLSAIVSLLGSSFVGSLVGGIFGLLNRKTDIESKRLDLDHEAARWAHDASMRDKDLEVAKVEATGRKDVAIVEADGAIETARMNAINAAQAADRVTAEELRAAGKLRWLLVLAMAFSKWVRPMATVALGGAAIYVNLVLLERFVAGWAVLTAEQRYEISIQAFSWITGQASAVFGFWFVSRSSAGAGTQGYARSFHPAWRAPACARRVLKLGSQT